MWHSFFEDRGFTPDKRSWENSASSKLFYFTLVGLLQSDLSAEVEIYLFKTVAQRKIYFYWNASQEIDHAKQP